MPEAQFEFTATADYAYQQTVNRNVAGSRLSDRLWKLNHQNIKDVNDVIAASIRNGRDLVSAAKELLNLRPSDFVGGPDALIHVKIPKYIRDLEDAARRARALSDSSILTQTIKKYRRYIDSLTRAGEPHYQHLGMRGASRMLVKRLQSQNQEVYEKAVEKWVKRKAAYHARLVMRNETNEAHWRALVAQAQDKPYVTAMKWNFGSHPEYDICDEIKSADLFGLGPGVYPKDQVPDRPHPACNCFLSQVMDDDYFKNYTPPQDVLERVRADPRFPEFKSWATGWLKKIGAGEVAPVIAPKAVTPEPILTPEEEAHFIQDVTSWKPGYVFKWRNLDGKITHVKTEQELQKLIDKDRMRLKKK
uniref:Putative capsid assembly protein n=1 Tax=viral metagenome TaxID=1070528 RepID=A0A6M3L3V4_9ZZZZ